MRILSWSRFGHVRYFYLRFPFTTHVFAVNNDWRHFVEMSLDGKLGLRIVYRPVKLHVEPSIVAPYAFTQCALQLFFNGHWRSLYIGRDALKETVAFRQKEYDESGYAKKSHKLQQIRNRLSGRHVPMPMNTEDGGYGMLWDRAPLSATERREIYKEMERIRKEE